MASKILEEADLEIQSQPIVREPEHAELSLVERQRLDHWLEKRPWVFGVLQEHWSAVRFLVLRYHLLEVDRPWPLEEVEHEPRQQEVEPHWMLLHVHGQLWPQCLRQLFLLMVDVSSTAAVAVNLLELSV